MGIMIALTSQEAGGFSETCWTQGWGSHHWLAEAQELASEFGMSRCKLLHRGWINNKVLLYSMGNYFNIL